MQHSKNLCRSNYETYMQYSSMNRKKLNDLERRRFEEVRLRKIIQDAQQKKYKDTQQLEQLQQSEQQLKNDVQ